MAKYLGIDWGEKKIGLALGSSETGLALTDRIVENSESGFDYIKSLCHDEEINIVVIGKLRDKNKKFDKFIGFLNNLDLKIELADERLTTKMAGKLNGDLRGQDDAVAAQIILQSWMDRLPTNQQINYKFTNSSKNV